MRYTYDPADLQELLSRVGSSDDDAHYHALSVLQEHAEQTRGPLIALLKESPSEFQRSRCVTALTGMDHPEVEKALLHALQHDSSSIVRDVAVTGLRGIEDKETVPIFIDALSDRSEIVRRWCADILGRLGDERAVPRLKEALQHKDEWLAFRAAESLRQWNVPEARTTLEHLRDEALESSVRTCAKQALWEWDHGKVK
ncbi:HEAT repeat protein [Roseimicrobium gellanilyticum]|uniref:HEAT repeat protein n=1 Tax=Roseimicrobium gellanilyticum TaxID=748857 RepID=A0A366HQ94_9BACT|nr:HEAT repeat domain-containing protein [Roseimicrobium gellanilyticum]RBP45103.1 HEAT repeat protein [Roseimicrobium gellanilyticum]